MKTVTETRVKRKYVRRGPVVDSSTKDTLRVINLLSKMPPTKAARVAKIAGELFN